MLRKNKKNYTKLPESELQIMQIIWDMDKDGVKDIHAGAMLSAYPDKIGHLALTTVLTLITRLQTKGFIKLEKHGRANCAIVIADEDEYKRKAAADFVATVYKNNTKGLISALYSDGILSEDDIADLRREIARDNLDLK
ncbi:MAG: BlaI/MecI/CopY family transcriptional regulator [Clostridiales bacterium]|nr:BlaI/MecI/CopY family transcriptional regulator [Clostridiales bacterium]